MYSLYAQYLEERTKDKILECPFGFATYRYLDENKTVYIMDIFVSPEKRKEHWATTLANAIVKEAKEKGATKLLGSVVPSMRNSTVSMKVLLAYGMTLDSSANDYIIFRKEI